jgi:hypothetical protein
MLSIGVIRQIVVAPIAYNVVKRTDLLQENGDELIFRDKFKSPGNRLVPVSPHQVEAGQGFELVSMLLNLCFTASLILMAVMLKCLSLASFFSRV